MTNAHSRVRIMVNSARRWVRVNDGFSVPAPNWVVDGAKTDSLSMEIVFLGERGVVRYSVKPQSIVIAVVE